MLPPTAALAWTVAVWIVAQSPTDPAPAVQWTVLGILALVLAGVGRGVWVLLDRAEKRLTMAEERRIGEYERGLAMQEKLAAALIESAASDKRLAEVIDRMEEGYREVVRGLERLLERLERLEGRG